MSEITTLLASAGSVAGGTGLMFFMFRHYSGRLNEMKKEIESRVHEDKCSIEHGHVVETLKKGDRRFDSFEASLGELNKTLNAVDKNLALLIQRVEGRL